MGYNFSRYRSVWALIAINTLVFIITSIRPDIGNSLALAKPFLASYSWTILTAMFIHANILHILANMLTLYFFGTFCLQLIDEKWFWVVYLIGGIFGNILFLLIGPANSAVVGASGAIFAIGGLIAMMRPTQKVLLYFIIPMPLWVGIGLGFLLTVFIPGVAWQGHLGGLIAGLIAGYFFRRRERRRLTSGYYHVQF
jgi:membrane associated rhomboid family serine protease